MASSTTRTSSFSLLDYYCRSRSPDGCAAMRARPDTQKSAPFMDADGARMNGYSLDWMTTGPPRSTSIFRTCRSSSRIPTRGVAAVVLALVSRRWLPHSNGTDTSGTEGLTRAAA